MTEPKNAAASSGVSAKQALMLLRVARRSGLTDDEWESLRRFISQHEAAAPAASSPEVADERATMFDAFGNPRKRYVRLTVDGTHCVDKPENLAENIGDMAPGEYITADVFLSEREFNDLPEFDGF